MQLAGISCRHMQTTGMINPDSKLHSYIPGSQNDHRFKTCVHYIYATSIIIYGISKGTIRGTWFLLLVYDHPQQFPVCRKVNISPE